MNFQVTHISSLQAMPLKAQAVIEVLESEECAVYHPNPVRSQRLEEKLRHLVASRILTPA
jgi:hypothetical protein